MEQPPPRLPKTQRVWRWMLYLEFALAAGILLLLIPFLMPLNYRAANYEKPFSFAEAEIVGRYINLIIALIFGEICDGILVLGMCLLLALLRRGESFYRNELGLGAALVLLIWVIVF